MPYSRIYLALRNSKSKVIKRRVVNKDTFQVILSIYTFNTEGKVKRKFLLFWRDFVK